MAIVKNSYFYTNLTKHGAGYDYAKVKRWTKKMPVLDADKILIPINANKTHWVLGCVNIRDKRIEFYDSLSDGTTEGARSKFQNLNRPCPLAAGCDLSRPAT